MLPTILTSEIVMLEKICKDLWRKKSLQPQIRVMTVAEFQSGFQLIISNSENHDGYSESHKIIPSEA